MAEPDWSTLGLRIAANDVVIALSRSGRGAALEDHHRAALDWAEGLLDALERGTSDDLSIAELRALAAAGKLAIDTAQKLGGLLTRDYWAGLLKQLRVARGGEPPHETVLDFFEVMGA